MRPRALIVHGSCENFSVLYALEQNAHGFFVVHCLLFGQPLDVHALLDIFPDGPQFFIGVELSSGIIYEVEDLFVVYLHVGALDIPLVGLCLAP